MCKNLYEKLKEAHLGAKASLVPSQYHSNFVCCFGGSSEAQFIIGQMIPTSAKKILIVGVYGGRDYFYLKLRGHEVYAIDLKFVPDYDNFQIANIGNGTPYPDRFFDAVVMSEVLEHLLKDHMALEHIRRVLKDDGVLVLSIPFLHEAEPTHIRLHSRVSVMRLLECCGWKVDKVVERPGLGFWPLWFNLVNHAINALVFFVTGKTIYSTILPFFWKLEYLTGQHRLPWRRFSNCWGGYFKCYKESRKVDYVALNQQTFCQIKK